MTGGSYGIRKVSKNANNGETTKEEANKDLPIHIRENNTEMSPRKHSFFSE